MEQQEFVYGFTMPNYVVISVVMSETAILLKEQLCDILLI